MKNNTINKKGIAHLATIIFVSFILFLGYVILYPIVKGAPPFGPERMETVTVTRLYVDVSGSKETTSSHYMVATDKGVFEVNNSIILGIWNADEIYSQLESGKTYNVKLKGNKLVNFLFQRYPYIIEVNVVQK